MESSAAIIGEGDADKVAGSKLLATAVVRSGEGTHGKARIKGDCRREQRRGRGWFALRKGTREPRLEVDEARLIVVPNVALRLQPSDVRHPLVNQPRHRFNGRRLRDAHAGRGLEVYDNLRPHLVFVNHRVRLVRGRPCLHERQPTLLLVRNAEGLERPRDGHSCQRVPGWRRHLQRARRAGYGQAHVRQSFNTLSFSLSTETFLSVKAFSVGFSPHALTLTRVSAPFFRFQSLRNLSIEENFPCSE